MTSLLLDHFHNPRNAGELPGADGRGGAGDPGCGVVIKFFINFDAGNLAEARFQASGSSAAIAAGSLITEIITGRSWQEAARLPSATIEAALSGDSERGGESIRKAAFFAVESLHAALEDAIGRGTFPKAKEIHENSVLVAMSGGVDSSTACLLERNAGRDVVGVTMRLWSDPSCEDVESPSCCSPEAIHGAREVCHGLGLPHLTVDYTETFAAVVVDDFVGEYMAGRTPNPCARCNGRFRFHELILLAARLGAAQVATGHYVRLRQSGGDGRLIVRGADQAKDQSYMLWGIKPALLERLDFPLGELSKDDSRNLAREAGIAAHNRPESQEVCFIPDDDYRRFLRSRAVELPGAGDIVDAAGDRLGSHGGFIDYTVGQRHGLGVSAPEPLYVLRTVPEENLVVAGSRAELAVSTLVIGQVNSFVPADELLGISLMIQPRYNAPAVPGRIVEDFRGSWRLELDQPVHGIAPGQSAVIYDDQILMAGGVIETAF